MAIKKINTTLFESKAAQLKVYAETVMIKTNADRADVPIYFFSTKYGTMYANSNPYLVFEYRHPEDYHEHKAIYMSHAHMYWLKSILADVKDTLIHEKAWLDDNGILYVNEGYDKAFTLDEIGRDKKWISFRLVPVEGRDGKQSRGIQVSFAGTENTSILTMDEFLSIYQIVTDFNLVLVQLSHATICLTNMDRYTYQNEHQGYNNSGNQSNYRSNNANTNNTNNNSGNYRQPYNNTANSNTNNKPQNGYKPRGVSQSNNQTQNVNQNLAPRDEVKRPYQNSGNAQADSILNSNIDESGLFDSIMEKK